MVGLSEPGGTAAIELCETVIAATDAAGARVRALGGLGVHLRVPERPPPLQRSYGDVDVVARRGDRSAIERALEGLGLVADGEFNSLNGQRRQLWWREDGSTHLDLFLGEFAMCHSLHLDDRLPADHRALAAADLLLTKLQIVELNHKDVQDAAALMLSHELGEAEAEGVIDIERLLEVLTGDWGYYTTVTDNLTRLPELVESLAPDAAARVGVSSREIVERLEREPKGRRFQLRAKVGRRKRWYELPDESVAG